VRLGSIRINNGLGADAVVDLTGSDTLGDVVTKINGAGLAGVTAALSTSGVTIIAGGVEQLSVTEVGGGTTASDLGILQTSPGVPGSPVSGLSVGPRITGLTPLSALSGGFGLDTSFPFRITNGQTTALIDLSSANTVEDMLNAINGANVGVIASVNDAGTGFNILNRTQGTQMTISEAGGTLAETLGVRSYNAQTALTELNGGDGVRTVDGDDLQIKRKDGTTFAVDVTSLSTIQDVIDAINTADAGGGVTASFATDGNGIVLTDTTGGAATLVVSALNFSNATHDLGLTTGENPVGGGVVTGSDVNVVQAAGLFSNLAQLRNALQTGDQAAITEAAEGLKADYDRIVRVRGETGARVQELDARQNRLEDQNIATKALLSQLEDVDFTEAVARFQTLQTSLQATLQMTGQTLNLSLLDFLR
ncbi:MAG: flagellin hook IN motif-containing protein, partial [Tepidisphaeraceae bacterium]